MIYIEQHIYYLNGSCRVVVGNVVGLGSILAAGNKFDLYTVTLPHKAAITNEREYRCLVVPIYVLVREATKHKPRVYEENWKSA